MRVSTELHSGWGDLRDECLKYGKMAMVAVEERPIDIKENALDLGIEVVWRQVVSVEV